MVVICPWSDRAARKRNEKNRSKDREKKKRDEKNIISKAPVANLPLKTENVGEIQAYDWCNTQGDLGSC